MSIELHYEIAGKQLVHRVEGEELTLGRGEDSNVVLAHEGISRRHARLFHDGESWRVADLGSTNGTRIRGAEDSHRALRNGDVILLGSLALRFVDAGAVAESPLEDEFSSANQQTIFRSTVDFTALAAADPQTTQDSRPAEHLQKLVAVLTRASESILGSHSLDQILEHVLDLVFEHPAVQRGFIMLRDEESDDLVVACSRERDAVETGGKFRFSRTIAEKVLHDKVAVITTDAQQDERFSAGQSISDLGIRSVVAAPLWRGDRVDGLICLDSKAQVGAFDAFDLDLLSALGNHVAIAIEQSRLQRVAVEKKRLERELAVARDIQMDTLPKQLPTLEGYELAGFSRPADQTGGDTFDLIPLDENRLMLLLGDATGHGIGPALSVTQVRSMLRVALRLGADLGEAFRHINDQLVQDLADNRFVTAFLGLLDRREHRVRYHSGGQGPTMHYRAAAGAFEWRSATTLPLGFMTIEDLKEPESIELAPGDILGLITDGVFEAENDASGLFGESGVEKVIREHEARPLTELAELVLAQVDDHVGSAPQADDITIVLLRRLPD